MAQFLSPAEIQERIDARAGEYLAGDISEDVFRASVFALGKRGDELALIVREQQAIKQERSSGQNRGQI